MTSLPGADVENALCSKRRAIIIMLVEDGNDSILQLQAASFVDGQGRKGKIPDIE